jgi:membrane protein DedA with SNARE-associated domain
MSFLEALVSLSGWSAYALVGGFAFAEAGIFIGVVLPGETALFIGGVLAAQGRVSLPIMMVVGSVAAVAGDSLGYEIGRLAGPRVRRTRLSRAIGDARWKRAEDVVRRRGPAALIVGRWVGVVRTLVPTVSGMSHMPYRKFLFYNAIGGISWAVVVIAIGYLAGASWRRIESYLGIGTRALVLACAVLVIVYLAIRWTRRPPRWLRALGRVARQAWNRVVHRP